MIKIRLQRKGRKKRPFYHIVVADSRSPRDGRIIERLGRFDNVSEDKQLSYDEERVMHWLKIGAQPSDTVRSIFKKEGILYKMHLIRWGKSEEEIEAALEEWRTAREEKNADKDSSRKAKQQEILKAEEKEYKKQLEEKAAAAAKELEQKKAKEEAEAKEAAEEEKAEAAEETADEVKEEEKEAVAEESAEPKAEEKKEAKAEKSEEKEEAKAEEAEEAPAEEEVKADDSEEEEKTEEKAEAEPAEEKKEEAPKEEKKAEEKETAPSQVSTDMNATEAIDHIKNTSLEELKGFVPKDEDRVTVQRAWESKQEE
ncbi:30S ribosomal protein S16 [Rhodohalobacter barkolensis]|uniref:Small ribosomal subunit protein bS16 n=1 Tax=Rhodohalobacter barkolensis TaxID=2053187 RepID=A0A2N0VEU2_9BACT|nr:30S ribosomal protein S16 [Rhodohalobacter barkolensis]